MNNPGTATPLPVFIVGYVHSGTTMLRKIIGRHESVFSIRSETVFFERLESNLPAEFPDLNDDAVFEAYVRFLISKTTTDFPWLTAEEAKYEPPPFDVDDDLSQRIVEAASRKRNYIDVFVSVYEMIAAAAGKAYWLEKTPVHIFHIDRIVQNVPRARFVEIVRDPRAILSSKKARKHTDWANRFGEAEGAIMQQRLGYDPLRDSLAWQAAVRAGSDAARRYPGAVYRLRYEDLVASPESETRRLCEFLNLTYDPTMLNIGWSNATSNTGESAMTGIDQRAVRKWQRDLTPDVIGLCQTINRKEMEELGYEFVVTSFGNKAKAIRWVGRSGIDLVSRNYELWQRRGAKGVYIRLRNSTQKLGKLRSR